MRKKSKLSEVRAIRLILTAVFIFSAYEVRATSPCDQAQNSFWESLAETFMSTGYGFPKEDCTSKQRLLATIDQDYFKSAQINDTQFRAQLQSLVNTSQKAVKEAVEVVAPPSTPRSKSEGLNVILSVGGVNYIQISQ